jgi:hypothetical protein
MLNIALIVVKLYVPDMEFQTLAETPFCVRVQNVSYVRPISQKDKVYKGVKLAFFFHKEDERLIAF